MTANDDFKAADSVLSEKSETPITGRIGGGKNFGLFFLTVAAPKVFANRPGSDLSYMSLSSAASTSISD